jgi:hypothetical protein
MKTTARVWWLAADNNPKMEEWITQINKVGVEIFVQPPVETEKEKKKKKKLKNWAPDPVVDRFQHFEDIPNSYILDFDDSLVFRITLIDPDEWSTTRRDPEDTFKVTPAEVIRLQTQYSIYSFVLEEGRLSQVVFSR